MALDEFRIVAQRKRRPRGLVVALAVAAAGLVALFALGRRGAEGPFATAASAGAPSASGAEAPSARPTPASAPAPLGGGPLRAEGAAVAAALRARDFAALESLFSEIVVLESNDPARGEPVAARAAAGLESADPALEEILVAWRGARLESPFAAYALAAHFNARAWAARGSRYAAETPGSAFAEFDAWRAKALPLARRAVELEPRFASAWGLVLNLALGEPGRCLNIAEEALAVLPASWRVRTALANCLRPRWGGRYDRIDELARQAAPHSGKNPRLRWLAGYVAFDRADLAHGAEELALAERWIREALERGGPAPNYLREQASILRTQNRPSEALAVLDRALGDWPDDEELLRARVTTLARLDRDAEARETIEQLAAVDPVAEGVDEWRRRLTKSARSSCESLARADLGETALAACDAAIEADPGDATARFWRGRALIQVGQLDDALAAFHAAVDLDPRHRDAILNLDWIYARRGQWQRIVPLWDAYLELEPEDARGWLERAGTRSRLRDFSGACADLRRSCSLGSDEACKLLRSRCPAAGGG